MNKTEILTSLQELAPEIDIQALVKNITHIEGNNNIVIQGVNGSTITIDQHTHHTREDVLSGILKKLQKPNKLLNHIPVALPSKVIGRDKDIEQIHQCLHENHALLLVNGIGGVGKTTASVYYQYHYADNYHHIMFVKGEGDFEMNFIEDRILHKRLGIEEEIAPYIEAMKTPEGEQAKKLAMDVIIQKLELLPENCLLLIDNAIPENIKLIEERKTLLPNFHFLITSRQQSTSIPYHHLECLEEADAIALFYSYYSLNNDRPHNDEAVKQIVWFAGYHTLTIELLAKTLRNHGRLDFESLIEQLQNSPVYLKRSVEVGTHYVPNEDYIHNILEVCFDISEILAESYMEFLLRVFSILPSQVPATHLEEMLEITNENESTYIDSLNYLIKNGWINWRYEKDSSYDCHSIIQNVLRKKMSFEKFDFNMIIEFYYDRALFSQMLISSNNQLYIRLNQSPYNFEGVSREYNNISIPYRYWGELEKALQNKILAINTWENNLDVMNKDYATLCNATSSLYIDLEQFDEAMVWANKGLSIRTAIFEEKSKEVAGSLTQVGVVFKKKTNLKESLTYTFSAIEIQKSCMDYDGLIISYNNIGETFMILKNYEEALRYFHEAINILESSSKNSIRFAITFNHIAYCYKKLENWELMMEYYKKSILKWKQVTGNIFQIKKTCSEMNERIQSAIQEKGQEWTQPYIEWFFENCSEYLKNK